MSTTGGHRSAVNAGSPSLLPLSERRAVVSAIALNGKQFSGHTMLADMRAKAGQDAAPWDEEPADDIEREWMAQHAALGLPTFDEFAWDLVANSYDVSCGMTPRAEFARELLLEAFEALLLAELPILHFDETSDWYSQTERFLMRADGFNAAAHTFLAALGVHRLHNNSRPFIRETWVYDAPEAAPPAPAAEPIAETSFTVEQALAEWQALWGSSPTQARDRELNNLVYEARLADRLRKPYQPKPVLDAAWADRLAASIEGPDMDKLSAQLDAEMRELHGEPPLKPAPAVLPQDLQDSRDVQAVIAATAGKLATTPENIRAAAVAALPPKPTLVEELASIPVTRTNEEIMEEQALAKSKRAELWLDELLEDVRDGLTSFDERKNSHGVVMLVGGLWLRRGSHDIYLERRGLAQGVIVSTQAPTGTWVPTVRRDEIRAWLKLARGKTAAETQPGTPGRELAETAVDELGEYAKSANRAGHIS